MHLLYEGLAEIEPSRRGARRKLTGMAQMPHGLIGLAAFVQRNAEADVQVGIVGIRRQHAPETVDGADVVAEALDRHAEHADGGQVVGRQGQHVGQRVFRGSEIAALPFLARARQHACGRARKRGLRCVLHKSGVGLKRHIVTVFEPVLKATALSIRGRTPLGILMYSAHALRSLRSVRLRNAFAPLRVEDRFFERDSRLHKTLDVHKKTPGVLPGAETWVASFRSRTPRKI